MENAFAGFAQAERKEAEAEMIRRNYHYIGMMSVAPEYVMDNYQSWDTPSRHVSISFAQSLITDEIRIGVWVRTAFDAGPVLEILEMGLPEPRDQTSPDEDLLDPEQCNQVLMDAGIDPGTIQDEFRKYLIANGKGHLLSGTEQPS